MRGAPGEAVLVRHTGAGLLDERYGSALRGAALWGVPTGKGRMLSFSTMAFHTVFLTRRQVDIIYGRPRSALGYLGRRLARPFDLVWRLARYTIGAIRLRQRR